MHCSGALTWPLQQPEHANEPGQRTGTENEPLQSRSARWDEMVRDTRRHDTHTMSRSKFASLQHQR